MATVRGRPPSRSPQRAATAIAALIAVSTRSAAHGPAAPAVLAAVAAGAVVGARRASLLRIVIAGGLVYVAVRLLTVV